ncbi:Hypothetical predicted protein [Cloeon dipterum]|uniref:MYND-type domain-containing protein n=1 Tax=Cloeon dipterum TaxID=197152 RepID=A0A8S1BVN8_9INSE|nr:Hypothetical predicted protein [Cloeon dipterum]
MDDDFLDLDNAGSVDVGFAEKCDPWKLESHFFPSKIGGKPAWLNFSHGTSHCGKCQSVNYCCREHQVADWKAGHNSECSSGKADPQRKCPLMLPEWEIEIEAEELTDETREGNREKSEEEKMKEYENLIKEGKAGTMHGDSSADPDFDAMNEDKEDVVFKKFKKRIAATPDQVLRYEKDGEPLWVSQEHQPNAIPPCEYCGGERTFEFQILPQMLNHLSLDQIGKSIDWGTIAIFTCKESCDNGDAYKSEFVYKQDIVQ